jgi:glutamyl-tRNA reductase
MRKLPEEPYEQWANRVKMFEQGRALQQLANGSPIEKVLTDMAQRISDKLMYPIMKEIDNAIISNYNSEADRKRYEENYIKLVPKAADHIDDTIQGYSDGKD